MKQKTIIFRLIFCSIFLVIATFLSSSKFSINCITTSFFIIAYLKIVYERLIKTLKNILKFNFFDENFLMLIASIAAFFLNEHFEAVIILLCYQLSEFFLDNAVENSKQSVYKLTNSKPKFVNLKTSTGYIQTEPEKIKISDVLIVKPGEQIPLDGVIINGESTLNVASMTGESKPVHVKKGDGVVSGSINLNNYLEIEVKKLFCNSATQRILKLINNIDKNKSKSEKFITKFAKIYTPVVVSIALLIAIIPPIFFSQKWPYYLNAAISILTISCPCALVVSVPLSFFCAITTAAKNLILIKGNTIIEQVAKIKTIIFDKTGTLTKGSFEIIKTNSINLNSDELIKLFITAESLTNHPISNSIKKLSSKHQIMTTQIKSFQELTGMGIKLTLVDESIVYVGSSKLMEKFNIKFQSNMVKQQEENVIIYIAKNGQFLGSIILADSLKSNALAVIKKLRNLKIDKIYMLTGDNNEVAKKISSYLNLDGFFSQLLPDEKLQKIQSFQKHSSIMFIGEGLNDVPAICAADVGISMGKLGADATIESSDIVLLDDDLNKIAFIFLLAKKTIKIVKQNIMLSISIKFIIMFLTIFISSNIGLAIFADIGVSLIATLNSIRILKT